MTDVEAMIVEAAARYRNWGRWGAEDQLGTLNYVTSEKVAAASRLVKEGRVFSLSIPFDVTGPQNGNLNRFNPVHTMLEDGGDWAAGYRRFPHGIGGADDLITMPLQCGTHWDGLSHIFDHGKMWNGYDSSEVLSTGAGRNGIE